MKLHLGCGKRYIPGYRHIDVVEYDHIDIVHSINSLPMISDNSCSVVYSCHVLEHFHKKQVPVVLKEWLRILRPGGVLRVAVPDMDALTRVYMDTKDLSLIIGPIYGRCDYLYNFHYTGFDYTTLSKYILDAGASKVGLYNWRNTEHAHIDDYSQAYIPQDKENGVLISLNVEAVK